MPTRAGRSGSGHRSRRDFPPPRNGPVGPRPRRSRTRRGRRIGRRRGRRDGGSEGDAAAGGGRNLRRGRGPEPPAAEAPSPGRAGLNLRRRDVARPHNGLGAFPPASSAPAAGGGNDQRGGRGPASFTGRREGRGTAGYCVSRHTARVPDGGGGGGPAGALDPDGTSDDGAPASVSRKCFKDELPPGMAVVLGEWGRGGTNESPEAVFRASKSASRPSPARPVSIYWPVMSIACAADARKYASFG